MPVMYVAQGLLRLLGGVARGSACRYLVEASVDRQTFRPHQVPLPARPH